MTKAEATRLAGQITDYFVRLTSFERRKDIRIYINADDWINCEYDGATYETPTHGLYDIVLVVSPDTTAAEFTHTVCHELAHILTSEYRFFYSVFIADPEDGENSISSQIFTRYHEDVAKRLAVVLHELWTKGGKAK